MTWTCPKCGKAFENQNQNHFCSEAPQTIDAYIAQFPESIQSHLKQVHETIRAAIPEAEEKISWRMPTFWKGQNIIHFAAFKNHYGIYPGDEAIVHFTDQLKVYKTSKGAIQLPYDQPIPSELIAEIAKWCFANRKHR